MTPEQKSRCISKIKFMLLFYICKMFFTINSSSREAAKCQQHGKNAANEDDREGVSKKGKRQSPINIHTVWTSPKPSGSPLKLINYDQKVPVIVTIDQRHYTIKVTPHPNVRIAISGGGLHGSYVLQSAHFHFGSEHLVDSERLALEAHLVHYREIHGNHTDAATNDPEGIAVLGTLFFQARVNPNLEKILKGTNCCGVKLRFRDLLPDNLDFYRYYGSLTTPPYSEAVVWTVFQNAVPVSKQQLHSIKNPFPKNIKTNYRDVQPLKGRRVERWEFKME